MARGHFRQRLGAAEQVHGLLGAAVHRIEQVDALHAVVVGGLHFREDLLDRRGVAVASGLVEGDARPLVGQDVDGVLRRGVHLLTGRPLELDLVEALRLHREVRGEGAVGLLRQWQRVVLVQDYAAARRGHGRRDREANVGALDGRHVAARFNRPRFEAGVAGEGVEHRQLVDRWQFDDIQREDGGAHAVRLDVVVGGLLEMEEHPLERSGLVGRDERHLFEGTLRVGADHQRRIGRSEAEQLRLHRLVGAARYLRAPGEDIDLVGA